MISKSLRGPQYYDTTIKIGTMDTHFKLDTGSPISIISIGSLARLFNLPDSDLYRYISSIDQKHVTFASYGGKTNDFYKLRFSNVSLEDELVSPLFLYLSTVYNNINLLGYDIISNFRHVTGDIKVLNFYDFDLESYYRNDIFKSIEPIEISELSFMKSNPLLDAINLM